MMTSQIKEPSIPDGKILDFLTKRFVNDTPEEYVRQNIEKALVRQYKYPIDSCKPEVSIKVGSSNKRVDVVIFEENKPHMQENAYILIETKKAKTNPHGKKDGIEQLKTYMAACLNAKFGLWTNGGEKKMADFCMMKSLRFHPLVRRKPKSTDPNGKIFRLLRLITCYLLFGVAIIILPVMLVCIKMMHSGSYLKSFSLKLKTNVLVLSTFM